MYWNHRVMKRPELGEDALCIVEVYYDEDDSIMGWTDNDGVWGEDLEGIRQSLAWMTDALDKPILDEAELLRQVEGHSAADEHIKGEQHV